jgi:hypothetical protein
MRQGERTDFKAWLDRLPRVQPPDLVIQCLRPLEARRGPILCLRVRSIGAAAALRIGTHGVGFETLRESTAASPVEETPVRLCHTPGRPKRTSEAAVP